MKTKMYFTGYVTSGKHGLTYTGNGNDKLTMGKQYLIETFSKLVERYGNGGSTHSGYEHAVRVYDVKTNELLSSSERLSVFKANKSCAKHNLAYISDDSLVKRCANCFKKFKEKLVEVK